MSVEWLKIKEFSLLEFDDVSLFLGQIDAQIGQFETVQFQGTRRAHRTVPICHQFHSRCTQNQFLIFFLIKKRKLSKSFFSFLNFLKNVI